MRIKIKLDREHSAKLLIGMPIAIKIPKDCDILELRAAPVNLGSKDSTIAELADVFFNGRKASKTA